jgi:exosortase
VTPTSTTTNTAAPVEDGVLAPLLKTRDDALAFLRHPANRTQSLLLAAAAALFVIAYADTFVDLANRWNQDSNYSHGWLVPFISVYLACQAWSDRTRRTPAGADPNEVRGGFLIGVTLIVMGALIRAATVVVASMVGECASMLLVLAGAIRILGGTVQWRRFRPAVLFLVFMVPWPSGIYSAIAFPMQLFVSEVSAGCMQACGVVVFQQGNVIATPKGTMFVAEACSGLRQLTAFFAICTCAAIMMDRPRVFRAIIFLAAIPIAVLTNILRVTVTGLILQYGREEWIKGWAHTLEGMLTLVVGLILLNALIQLLDWLCEAPEEKPARATGSPRVPAAA